MFGRPAVDDEHPQPAEAQSQFDPGFGCIEPADLAPAVQKQLQRADRQGQHAEAEEVEDALLDLGCVHEHKDHGKGQRTHGQVDQEHPAPVETLGQPAAERRTDDRSDHDACAVDGHGLPDFLAGIDVEQDRLRHGNDNRAAKTLKNPEHYHFIETGGDAAEQRRRSEAGNGDQEQPLLPQPVGQPAGQRRGDGRSHDIGGQDPGDLGLCGVERGRHMRQRHIGDRGVQHLHDGGQHQARRQQAAIGHLHLWSRKSLRLLCHLT